MRDPVNKPDEELSLLIFGRNSLGFTSILRDRVVEVHKQWIGVSLALGVCAFHGQISCNSGHKMTLTEFFPWKRICRTKSFISVKILVAIAIVPTCVVFVSSDTSARDFTSQ
jgi:hypothetical protein